MMKELCCLLVDDDPEDQEFFFDALHNVSTTSGCYAVSNGEEALSTLLQENFLPDYIFTDLNMPRMNGFEFIRILKGIEKFSSIPVIVISSSWSAEDKQKLKELGAIAIYSKGRPDILRQILRQYFGDHVSANTIG